MEAEKIPTSQPHRRPRLFLPSLPFWLSLLPALLLLPQVQARSQTSVPQVPVRPGTIVIDTGHTPKRPGAISASGRVEYEYNLALSDAVAAQLQERGYRVVRIAGNRQEIDLSARTRRAYALAPEAGLYLSIHHDSIQQAWMDAGRQNDYSGYAVFVSKKNLYFAHSLSCAEHIGQSLLKAGEHPSLYHATPVKGENRPLLQRYTGIHRYDDLIVLKNAATPTVLIEAGVIVNQQEAQRLSQPETIQHLAIAIAEGVAQCE